jgi:hypothetical protein
MAEAQRAFPNADVRVNKREIDYWLSEENMRAAPAEAKRFFDGAKISLTPYMRAGKLSLFEGTTDLIPGCACATSHGHTLLSIQCTWSRVEARSYCCGAMSCMSPRCNLRTLRSQSGTMWTRRGGTRARARLRRCGGEWLHGGRCAHLFPGLGHVRRNGEKACTWVPLNYSVE